MTTRSTGLYLAVAALLYAATPAYAQYKPKPLNDPATGESYHIEASAGFWFPTADMTVTSEGLGIPGSSINAENDLGFPTSKRLPEFQVTLRPARSHKLRMQYIPIQFDGSNTVTRSIVFNGQNYRFGTLVNSTLDWKAWRFNYEYDFITTNRGYGGFILEAKYTDVRVDLNAPQLGLAEFAHARAPIPALGGIFRVYVVPNISITGEVTGFKLPTVQNKYAGHYVDVDVYGTLNLTNNVGVQGGYRALDMGYLVNADTGSFTLRGPYVAAVVRY
ncbi:MAG TPA: hypothetical protein VFA59_21035 [Vicinamibacterales bacterium]|nr:hypothetical protein [Vicinamibacterales bacterium]